MSNDKFEPRVSLITLGVDDLARARAFYETGLGWSASSASQDDVVFFQAGALAVALFARPALAEDAGVPDQRGFSGITLAHNVREPADVDRLLAIAEAAGGRITKPAQRAFWGGRTGYFADPDGHLWEIAWNPHFRLAEDGALQVP
jgi:catechol 2,3-dioxygenase-like lactoylglutathione lyase family enzyme